MRRYVIAILALLCLSSCRLEQGISPDARRSDRLMYEQVITSIDDIVGCYKYIIYTEAVMGGYLTEAEAIKNSGMGNLIISIEPGAVIFNGSNNKYSFKVTTDGKSLAEGGEWQLDYTSQTQRSFTYNYKGIEGGNHAFKYNITRGNTTVNFVATPTVTEHNANQYISGQGTIRTEDYELVFKIQDDAPMLYRFTGTNPVSGVLEMTYTNHKSQTTRHAIYDIAADAAGFYDFYYSRRL